MSPTSCRCSTPRRPITLAEKPESVKTEPLRSIAAIAILPLAIMWLRTGTGAAVMIVAYAAFFPIVVNTVAGARGVNATLLRAAATMGRTTV